MSSIIFKDNEIKEIVFPEYFIDILNETLYRYSLCSLKTNGSEIIEAKLLGNYENTDEIIYDEFQEEELVGLILIIFDIENLSVTQIKFNFN